MEKEVPKQEIIKQRAKQPPPFADRKLSKSPRLEGRGKTKTPRPGRGKKPEKKKSRWCCWTCLVLLILAILIPSYAAIASGIVKVPILTPLIYGKGPQPKRVVEPAKVGLETITEKMTEAAKSGLNQVTFTEEELTTLLKQDNKQLRDANLAIDPNEIEVFGYLEEGTYNTHLTVGFMPEITEGELDFKFRRVKLGKLPIPVWGINLAVKRMLGQQQEAINQFVEYIDKIELEKGELKIKGNIRRMMEQQFLPKGQPGKEAPPEFDLQPRTDI